MKNSFCSHHNLSLLKHRWHWHIRQIYLCYINIRRWFESKNPGVQFWVLKENRLRCIFVLGLPQLLLIFLTHRNFLPFIELFYFYIPLYLFRNPYSIVLNHNMFYPLTSKIFQFFCSFCFNISKGLYTLKDKELLLLFKSKYMVN